MLVVTRKIEAKIMINNDIKVVIVGISGDRIKIGIEAPKDVSIRREELAQIKDQVKQNE